MKRQVITGPRMSGKTTKLLEAVRDFAYQPNKQILVLTNMHHESCMLMKKFSNDNRFYVESRIEDPVRRVNFKNGSQIGYYMDKKVEYMGGQTIFLVANDDILRQDGSLISMNSDIEDFEVLQTGRYTLLISHAGGGANGMLRVNLDIQR